MASGHMVLSSWYSSLLFVRAARRKPFIPEALRSAGNVMKIIRARYEGPTQAPPAFVVIKRRGAPGDPVAIISRPMKLI